MMFKVEVEIADEKTVDVYLYCRYWVSLEKVDVEWEADKVVKWDLQRYIVLSYRVDGRDIGEIIEMMKRDVMRFSKWITERYGKVEMLKEYAEAQLQVKKGYKCPLTRAVCMREECMMYDWRTERCGLLDVEVYCDG